MKRLLSRICNGLRSQDAVIMIGSMIVIMAATLSVVSWPIETMKRSPSHIWERKSARIEAGRKVYIRNGCVYCHTQYVRPQDWDIGAERIAQSGDYYRDRPVLLGSERTGYDLSQEGGEHPRDWHYAHFMNPRYTRPRSLMPSFAYEGDRNLAALTAYLQSQGGTMAAGRMRNQTRFGAEAAAAFRRGPDDNVRWLHSRVPKEWRAMPTASPVTTASVARGEKVYQDYCMGCHGPVGDGNGPAAKYLVPTPLNFPTLRRHLIDGRYIGGILYYQIMNGVTGTAMPYFKKDLESAKIWDVGNYIEYSFVNHTDDKYRSIGIPAAYEGREARPTSDKPDATPTGSGTGGVR